MERATRALAETLDRGGGPTAPLREARALLTKATGLDELSWHAHPQRSLEPDWLERAEHLLARRLRREPLAYLLGHCEWYGRDLLVRPGVLVPRPDTETLIDWVADHLPLPAGLLVDVGTGSGCILATLLAEHPQARGLGIEIDAAALEVAAENLARVGVAARAELLRGSSLGALHPRAAVGLVVSNPPYVTEAELARCEPEVRLHEPRRALLAPPGDPLGYYRRLLDQVGRMARRPAVLFEVGCGRAAALEQLLRERGYTRIHRREDLAGIPRAVGALL